MSRLNLLIPIKYTTWKREVTLSFPPNFPLPFINSPIGNSDMKPWLMPNEKESLGPVKWLSGERLLPPRLTEFGVQDAQLFLDLHGDALIPVQIPTQSINKI